MQRVSWKNSIWPEKSPDHIGTETVCGMWQAKRPNTFYQRRDLGVVLFCVCFSWPRLVLAACPKLLTAKLRNDTSATWLTERLPSHHWGEHQTRVKTKHCENKECLQWKRKGTRWQHNRHVIQVRMQRWLPMGTHHTPSTHIENQEKGEHLCQRSTITISSAQTGLTSSRSSQH